MRIVLTCCVLILAGVSADMAAQAIPVVPVRAVKPAKGATKPAKKPITKETTTVSEVSEEVQTLRRQLLSTTRTPETRYDAARMLLRRDTPEANAALLSALGDTASAETQLAAARALGETKSDLSRFRPALFSLVRANNASVARGAALAIASDPAKAVGDTLRDIASDDTAPLAMRFHVIAALSRRIEKQSVAVLIDLLRAPEPAIRDAARDALEDLTGLDGLGQSHARWTKWWTPHTRKSTAEYLRAMIDNNLRVQSKLRRENAELLARLLQARKELFDASSATRKPVLAADMLTDDIEDIRLLGAQLTATLLAGDVQLPYRLQRRIHGLLHDASPKMRSAGAALEAALGDKRAAQRLLITLQNETHPTVRIALLEAIGQLASPSALQTVLHEVSAPSPAEAKAAADALRRILRAAPPKEPKPIAAILNRRYDQADSADAQTPPLREALLEALAATALPEAANRMTAALKDPAGVVRLAAVNGLRQLQAKSAAKAIAPLAADSDRGVRLAAVGALAQLAGMDYFKTIFQRTKPAVEDDTEVRKAARDALMGLFREADAGTLAEGIKLLDSDRETLPLRIQLLRLYVQRQRTAKAASLPSDLRRLGKALGQNGEHAQSATALVEAYQLLTKTPESPKRLAAMKTLWIDCLEAMLAGGDPAFAQFMASPPAEPLFDAAYSDLLTQLDTLRKAKNYLAITTLSDAALTRLPKRLSPTRTRQLTSLRGWASAKQAEIDAKQIQSLLGSLLSADLDTRDEAIKAIKPLGRRAIKPLLDQLSAKLKQTPPAVRDEGILFDLLRQIEPTIGEYDPAADLKTRTALVDALRKKFVK